MKSCFLYYLRILENRKVEFMKVKRKRQPRKHLKTVFALGKVQTEQLKGRDKTMLQKETEYRQAVSGE